MDAFVARIVTVCGIPVVKNLPKLGIAPEWEPIDFLMDIGSEAL
jgi:hypothetical protein